MKSKPKTKATKKIVSKSLMSVINPRYVTFSTRFDPIINRRVKYFISLPS